MGGFFRGGLQNGVIFAADYTDIEVGLDNKFEGGYYMVKFMMLYGNRINRS